MVEASYFPEDFGLFGRASEVRNSSDFKDLVGTLAENQIYHEGAHLDRLAWAIALAQQIAEERQLGLNTNGDGFFADPMELAKKLAEYSNTDSPSIIAALLYASLRRSHGEDPDPQYLERIDRTFGPEITDIIRDALDLAKTDIHQDIDETSLGTDAEEASTVPHTAKGQDQTVLEVRTEDTGANNQDKYTPLIRALMRDPHDERAYLIRLTEWILYLRTFDEQDARRQPTAEELETTINLYVPLSEIFYLRQTKTDLGEEWLRLTHPADYQSIKDTIKRLSVDVDDIEQRIFAALRNEFIAGPNGEMISLDKFCEIEFRVKSAESIYRNMVKEGLSEPNPKDFFGFRIIIDTLRDNLSDKDEGVVYRVHDIIRRAFTPIEGGFSDYHKSNGYRSLNDHLCLPEDPTKIFAIHFVSQRMFAFNEGTPEVSHAAYKFKEVASEITQRHVTVFVRNTFEQHPLFRPQYEHYPESQRYRLPLGSRAADMLAFLKSDHPDVAFMVADIAVERGSLFRRHNPLMDPFRELLASSDEIELTINPALLHDPQHRRRIIAAVTDPAFKQYLCERDWMLAWEEAGKPLVGFIDPPARRDAALTTENPSGVTCG